MRNTLSESPGELWKRENRTREERGGRGGERVRSEGVRGWSKRGLREGGSECVHT